MFENKEFEGIYYSRFIASWYLAGGKPYDELIGRWLRTLTINGKEIPEKVVQEILDLNCGKLELESNAKHFMETSKERKWIF